MNAHRSTAPAGPPRLLERVRLNRRARHYSPRTEKAHVGWVRGFILFHGKRQPDEMGAPEVTGYLTHLAVRRQLSASTQNQAFGALVNDADLGRGEITARDGKGRKDRVTVLPGRLTEPLRAHLERVRQQHLGDVAGNAGFVALSDALGRKDPGAGLCRSHLGATTA